MGSRGWCGWATARCAGTPGVACGSSAAALIALAEVLAADPSGFRHPIRFVWFTAEEYGLLGSLAHVDGLDAPVAAMIQLDPIGYDPGDAAFLWVVRDEASGTLGDRFAAAATTAGAGVDVLVIDAENIGGDARSDHHPLREAGIPALHLASFPHPPAYHTMDDTIDNVDPTFTREVAVAVGQLVVELAEPRAAEAQRGCGGDTPGPSGALLWLGGVFAVRRARASGAVPAHRHQAFKPLRRWRQLRGLRGERASVVGQ